MSRVKERLGSAFKNGTLRLLGVKPERDTPATEVTAVLEPVPVPRSRVNDRDVYAELAPERLDATWEKSRFPGRTLAAPARRAAIQEARTQSFEAGIMQRRYAYESRTPAWMLEELHRADRKHMARPVMEMRRFLARCLGDFMDNRDWETPQYLRRHADNMAAIGTAVERVVSGDVAGAKALVLAGARGASTRWVPSSPVFGVEEEATA